MITWKNSYWGGWEETGNNVVKLSGVSFFQYHKIIHAGEKKNSLNVNNVLIPSYIPVSFKCMKALTLVKTPEH